MSEVVKLKITKAGLSAFFNAQINGVHLELKTMKYSTDNFESVIMDERTSLSNIVSESFIVASGTSTATNTIRFITVINSNSELYVGSVGVYTADGVLFAVASKASGSLFKVYSGISFTATFGLALTAEVLNGVTVVVDQNTPIMYSLMANHEAHNDPHPQYAKGTELDQAIDTFNQQLGLLGQGQGTLGGQMIGIGQTYVNVKAQRLNNGTTYINNTNKPIHILIQFRLTDGNDPLVIRYNGEIITTMDARMNSGTIYVKVPFTIIIPPLHSYSVTGGEIEIWRELKS